MNQLMQFFSGLAAAFNAMNTARKTMIAGAGLLTVVLVGALSYFAAQVEYQALFSGLSSEDAAAIVARLQEKKVPYKVSASGDVIYAPADKVPELRMEMAATGALRGGIVGYEIFDNKTLGATDFEQQLNFRRALQGELSRTINSLDEVQQSRVHIAFPKESLFVDQQKKATASVTLKLKGGKTLRPGQIEGIAHLVARSVEGLGPEDVIVVDSRGNILSKNQDEGKNSRLSIAQLDYRRHIEKDMAAQVQTMLENVVGRGKAVVRVTADLDFRVTEKTEETYDPESPVVRSTQRQTDKTTTTAAKTGTTGSPGGQEHEKTDETVNYEINRVVNKTVMPVGEIRKLSLAVLVDGIYAKNDKGEEVYQERPKKDIDAIEELVRKSAGFNASRGDQVVVSSMPFNRMEQEAALAGSNWQDVFRTLLPLFKYVVLLAAFAMIFLWVVRPLIRGAMATASSRPVMMGEAMQRTAAPASIGAGEGIPMVAAPMEGPRTETDIVRQLASTDAKRFAEILRNWVN
ncbi:MAG: flagellar basal-body MS-ring/collar protein FliF [Pseudomonadota bacterium]|nr:flagellar basal-body MS-ring/collar protein FliF [Pseudomonadota bacterium]